MQVEQLVEMIQPITRRLAGHELDSEIEADLNLHFPADGETVATLEQACHAAIEAGWMCSQGGGGRRFGRVIEAGPATDGFSVDVVDLTDIVGPHHRHPKGEICLILPQTESATFDGQGDGWMVNPAGSAHRPTVAGGRALVLYLLPDGEIEFTGQ